jgi:hypothetical protein
MRLQNFLKFEAYELNALFIFTSRLKKRLDSVGKTALSNPYEVR